MNLFEEFDQSSEEQWREKITTDLKGKPIESLIWESEIGAIDPVIFAKTSERAAPNNGQFTRGDNSENNEWQICQTFYCNDPQVNKAILDSLAGGANALRLHELSENNINQVLEGVQLDLIHIYIPLKNDALATAKAFINYIKSKGYDTSQINGSFDLDIIQHLETTGGWIDSSEVDHNALIQLIQLTNELPNFGAITIGADLYSNAGANTDYQIALALSHGNEYLNFLMHQGVDMATAIKGISFNFAIGTSYFLEIAKIRAFRNLWHTVASQYTDQPKAPKIHAATSELCYSKKDNYTNLLRATTQGMSAVIAGCNSLTISPYDLKEGSISLSNRMARNLQLLLQEEAYLDKVSDPSGGSYYIEQITDQLIDSSWSIFQEMEASGGLMANLKQGSIQTRIKDQLSNRKAQLLNESKVMIGVNKFPNTLEDYTPETWQNEATTGSVIEPITVERLAEEYEQTATENA